MVTIPRLEPNRPNYLPIAEGRIVGFMPFPRTWVLCKMLAASFMIWTRLAIPISYDNNHYTTYASIYIQGTEAKYGIIFKTFFSQISPIFEKKKKKKHDKSKFSWSALLFKHFFIKIQPVSKKRKETTKNLWFAWCWNLAEKIPKKLEFLFGHHQAQTLTPLITLYGAF